MLNLPIAMFKVALILFLLLQESPTITAPQPGETLRGLIQIQGRMTASGFASAELAFTFASSASNPSSGWFVIQSFSQPTANSVIAEWDTTAVTDGDYALRLRVILQDGSFQDALVSVLKIRNNEPLPTATSFPTFGDFNFQSPDQPGGIEASPTSPILYPTRTPLPANPASVTASSVSEIFWQSALAALVLFATISLLLRLRRN